MKSALLSAVLTLIFTFFWISPVLAAKKPSLKNMQSLIGIWEGSAANDFDALPDCSVEIAPLSNGQISVTLRNAGGITVFDKDAEGGARTVTELTHRLPSAGPVEVTGAPGDFSVWKRQDNPDMSYLSSTTRFVQLVPGKLFFVQLNSDTVDFGQFFGGPRSSYQTGCYQLRKKTNSSAGRAAFR